MGLPYIIIENDEYLIQTIENHILYLKSVIFFFLKHLAEQMKGHLPKQLYSQFLNISFLRS